VRDFILWGGAGQAKVLAELLRRRPLKLVAVIDQSIEISPFDGIELLRNATDFDDWLVRRANRPPAALVAIGGSKGAERRRLQRLLSSRGCEILTAIHDAAYVADDAKVGAGSQILAGSVVGAGALIGEAVIVNTGATVDHDCRIDDGVHLAPGVTLAGEIIVEADAFVGAGATVLPRVRIGKGAIVGAGAVVTRDVPPGAVVIGIPARLQSAVRPA
jgi:sugar O-acyltransferase (sialic acid O-acetyltransferase NeuD family)